MKAGDICSRHLISVQKNETLNTAIHKMRSNFISQIPVFDGSRVVGILSEDALAKSMIEKDEKNIRDMLISFRYGASSTRCRCINTGQSIGTRW